MLFKSSLSKRFRLASVYIKNIAIILRSKVDYHDFLTKTCN